MTSRACPAGLLLCKAVFFTNFIVPQMVSQHLGTRTLSLHPEAHTLVGLGGYLRIQVHGLSGLYASTSSAANLSADCFWRCSARDNLRQHVSVQCIWKALVHTILGKGVCSIAWHNSKCVLTKIVSNARPRALQYQSTLDAISQRYHTFRC